MGGFAKLTRCLLTKPIFQNEKILKIWVWCLLKATHTEHEQMIGLQKITLQPGQFPTGRYAGAKELNLNPSTFWKYMLWLEKNESLDIKSNNKYSLITVANWEFYQGKQEKSDSKSDSKMTTKCQQNDTNKNGKKEKNKDTVPFDEILNYLNQVCGTKYKVVDAHKKHINARWGEGYTFDNFKTVIDKKHAEWAGTEQATYLRPETLFGTKFDSYLNQIAKPKKDEEEIPWV